MKIVSAALLCLLMLFSFTPSVEEEKIPWREDQKLSWEDFRGTPNGAADFVASTNSGVSFAYSYKEVNGVGKIDLTIQSNFYPNLSWYRPDRVSEYILAHEQLHFDISELHARKLRKALSVLPHNRDFKKAASKIYNELETARRDMQQQYDSDSNHSNNDKEEYRWRTFVAEQLNAFQAWE